MEKNKLKHFATLAFSKYWWTGELSMGLLMSGIVGAILALIRYKKSKQLC